jgi:hypothetical protein
MDQYIKQLGSKDPNVRRQAVIALGRTGDPQALPYLASVYKSDSVSEIRELALKAGRYIRQQNGLGDATPVARPSGLDQAIADDDVTPDDERRAKEYLEAALDLQVRGNAAKAADTLAKAFTINPRLRRDTYALSLAATITGREGSDAVNMVLTQGKAKRSTTEMLSEKAKGGAVGAATWSDAFIDLMLYALVWTGGSVVFTLFSMPRLISYVNAVAPLNPNMQAQSLMNMAASFNVVQSIISSLTSGLWNAFWLLVFLAIIHFCAVTILGGDGRLTNLIHKTIPVQSIAVVVMFVAFFAALYYGLGMIESYAGQQRLTQTQSQAFGSFFTTFGCGFLLFWVALMAFTGYQAGQNYDMGMARGCVSVVMTVGGFVIGGCCIIWVISSAVSNLVMSTGATFP